MADTLYTSAELVAKLKALDSEMDLAESSSELDTGQSRHKYAVSTRTLREQYEKYSAMLQQVDPATYAAIFGPSVIRFTGSSGGFPCRR